MDYLLGAVDVLAAGSTAYSVLIIGQILPYIPQLFHMIHTQDSSGFSTAVPMVIISASLLRLVFWYGLPRLWKQFGLVLVVQSLVMIVTQLVMIHVSVHYMRSKGKLSVWGQFWAWDMVLLYCRL